MSGLKWFIFVLIFICFESLAQRKKVVRLDNSSLTIRSFNKAALKEYKANKEFIYTEKSPDLSPSVWDRFWIWFWSLFKNAVSNSNAGGFFKIFSIILGSLTVIFLIVKLTGMDAGYLLTGKSRQIDLPYNETLENIHEISFDEEIENAINKKDYRLAVRLLYLKSLKRLSDTGRIIWVPNKTNSTYINELKSPDVKERFKLLTNKFEYVWYGGSDMDYMLFEKINQSFKEFNLNVR
ncbi:MAG TPA: hypothetical protein VF602_10955 [Pedobacter sp.]|jgi:hypothetical protein